MQALAEDQNAPPSRYGLDAPTATMTIKTGSSSATLTLGKTENAVVFAKDSNRPLIFTVAPTLRADVVKDVGEFRRKDLFDFRSFTATRVEFTRGGPDAGVRPDEGQGRQGRVDGGRRQDARCDEDRGAAGAGVGPAGGRRSRPRRTRR